MIKDKHTKRLSAYEKANLELKKQQIEATRIAGITPDGFTRDAIEISESIDALTSKKHIQNLQGAMTEAIEMGFTAAMTEIIRMMTTLNYKRATEFGDTLAERAEESERRPHRPHDAGDPHPA